MGFLKVIRTWALRDKMPIREIALRSGKRQIDVEALVRAMVFNRLCAPDSNLGVLRWLDTVAMPSMPEGVTHQHLLRAMDALMDHVDRVEGELAKQIPPWWIATSRSPSTT